jgi:hypothetical protein
MRLNKAVDRFLLVETMRKLARIFGGLSEYTYYGLGGPFLEDCRILHEYCPEIKLVSIERDEDTYKRQKFHKFTSGLELIKKDFGDWLAQFQPTVGRQIFWLDYVDTDPQRFSEFADVLCKVADRSVVRITLKAEFHRNPFREEEATDRAKQTFVEELESHYGEWIAARLDESVLSRPARIVKMIQDMVRVQADRALPPAADDRVFQPLCTSHYNDSTDMLSVTGIVCRKSDLPNIRAVFSGWRFANLRWKQPSEIRVPIFSIKERLLLEAELPLVNGRNGKHLARKIAYSVVEKGENWVGRLEEYAEIHQYCPAFAKIVV